MRTCRVLVRLLLLGALTCHPRTPQSFDSLDEAANAAKAGSRSDARTLALAGFHAYLRQGNPSEAEKAFQSAREKDPADPFALYGEVLLARRRARPDLALEAALELLERRASHPLAGAAARIVLDSAGSATLLDDEIIRRSKGIFAGKPRGDAAYLFRAALATIYNARSQRERQEAMITAMGVPAVFVLAGPFSPFRFLAFDEVLPLEQKASLSGPLQSPFGPLEPRTLRFPDGRLSLAGEGGLGDVFFVAVDFDAPETANHIVRAAIGGTYKLFLDGELLFQRRGFERTAPAVHAVGVRLKAGPHRLTLKMVKEDRSGSTLLALPRADGEPANLTFRVATGPPPQSSPVDRLDVPLSFPSAASLERALESEAGVALSDFLAIRDAMARDVDGSKELLAPLEGVLAPAPFFGLRGDLDISDRTIPSKVAKGRATRDFEAATDRDPSDVSALLARAQLALDDNRLLEASEFIKQARAAYRQPGYPIAILEARVALGLGIDAQADQSALEALKLQPGLCEAMAIRYDLARRRDAISTADQLVDQLKSCPDGVTRAADHAKLRGQPDRALAIYAELVSRDPNNISYASALATLYVSQKRSADAEKVLSQLLTSWPHNAGIYKRLADTVELGGDRSKALQYRKRALAIDGGDLQLRRTIERAETGREILEASAIPSQRAIREYEAQRGAEDSSSAYVLDFAAIKVFPDGSMVDRIHVIQKALDQTGVGEIAEVAIPAGAQVLSLRTIKRDGAILEPETIADKETVSLPGVSVGDYVEYELLLAHRPRGPVEPGFTASNFYFQIARAPNNWSTYTVIAPKGMGMSVDAHNVVSPEPVVKGEEEVFIHEERRVPPLIPEPNAPPSGTEYLPFVSVGAGQTGNDALIKQYADGYRERGRLTYEVIDAARSAARGKVGEEAARAWHATVMSRLSGRDSGLAASAAFSLAEDRGSRLWALKSGLEAIGIPARIAAVRTFAVDPAPYKFPNEQLYPYFCVRAETAPGRYVWLDPLVRFSPFGYLPEQAANGRDAYLFPEPGRPLERVKTPANPKDGRGKRILLKLKLEVSGKLIGSGDEIYEGIDAAQLGGVLESASVDQRNQALQSALSRYFGGAEMSNLRVDLKREVGAPLRIHYEFSAPHFARVENEKLVVPPLTFPSQLGRRFVQMGSRRTPLFIDSSEINQTEVTVELPPGYAVSSPIPEIRTQSPFGTYLRHERQQQNQFLIDERFALPMARIPPPQYEDFAQFAGEVDLIQSRDLLIEKH